MAESILINRVEFINKLELVMPGISKGKFIEQSNYIVFQSGRLATYNDEVSCRIKSGLPKELTAAIRAENLVSILNKLEEEELTLIPSEGAFLFKGIRRRFKMPIEKDILLPTQNVEKPEEWFDLHPDFMDAVHLAYQITGDPSKFATGFVHIAPKWIESAGTIQMLRYPLRTGVKEEYLIKKTSLKGLTGLEMIQFAITPNWMHFRNTLGLLYSCRRYAESYPDLLTWLDVKGQPVALPKGLKEAIAKADEFSKTNPEDNLITVMISKDGLLRVRGEGSLGWYSEDRDIKYSGKDLNFMIPPQLLMELLERHSEFEIADDRIKVINPKFSYVACLQSVQTEKEE